MSKPWVMANEPVDLRYSTWFPSDCLSANLRHNVSVVFSQSSSNCQSSSRSGVGPGGRGQGAGQEETAVAQSMEVDQMSDGKISKISNGLSPIMLKL